MFRPTCIYLGLIACLLGVVYFEAYRIRGLKAQIASLGGQAQVTSRPQVIGSRDRTTLVAELDAALKENLKLRRTVESDQTQGGGIASRVAMLKDILNRLPEQKIPQLEYATEADWYAAVDGPLETVDDIRGALARIRASSETRFAKILHPALVAYMNSNAGSFPKDVGKLLPFFGESIDPALIQHYKIVRASELKSKSVGVTGEWAITQASVVDSQFDSHFVFGLDGWGYNSPNE